MRDAASTRTSDGSAGDVDYGEIGSSYARYRQPEPVIAAQILAALGTARRVLNVGAGAGSYEPVDREVVAVEPSATMRAQRPPHLSRALDAVAEALPFEEGSFDAAMATVTVHQWSDLERGLAELRRVTRGPIVLLVGDPALMRNYWLHEYAPEVREVEARRFPSISRIVAGLGGEPEIQLVPIPRDCRDGFNEAYYARPELLLEADRRLACSSWSLVSAEVVARFVEHLSSDLESGRWDDRHGHWRATSYWDGPLRLIVSSSSS